MKIIAICDTCRQQHALDFDPLKPTAAFSDWITKHPGHLTRFEYPRRSQKLTLAQRMRQAWEVLTGRPSWVNYLHNADVKAAYGTTVANSTFGLTLASLAASSTLLAGRESGSISNTSNKYLDWLFSGHYRAGAANNQAGIIRTAVVGAKDDTPNWPDVFDGTDSTETVTDQPTYDSICRVISEISGDNTASQTWYWGPIGVAQFFGGWLPPAIVLFVSQSIQTSTNVWSATEGDHVVKYTPVYATVI